jgi:hypothetical protein
MLKLGGTQHSEISILTCRNRLELAKERTHILINPHSFDCILISGANVVQLLSLKRQRRPDLVFMYSSQKKSLFNTHIVFEIFWGGSLICLHLTQSAKYSRETLFEV